MKLKRLDMSDCQDILKKKFYCKHINEKEFFGRICILKFEKISKCWKVNEKTKILDTNYIWIEFFPYNCNYCFTAMYDDKNNIIEWYIDITKTIEEENEEYIEDLFIDVVLLPNGSYFVLDEDELEKAYMEKKINQTEYNMALEEKKKIIKKLSEIDINKFKVFTNKYKENLLKYI